MIDAHFHIWQLDRGDYGWLTPALGAIHRDVSLDDWRRARATSGITAGLLVQAAPTEAETCFLLDQARDAPDVLGVVGWVDLQASDAPRRIRALATDPKLRGLRPMLQDLPGAEVPEVWRRWLAFGESRDLPRVLAHNLEDLVSLLALVQLLGTTEGRLPLFSTPLRGMGRETRKTAGHEVPPRVKRAVQDPQAVEVLV